MSNRLPNILTFGLAAGVLATTPAQAEPDEIRLASWTPPIEKIDESPRTKEDPLKPTSRYDVIDYLRPDQIMRAREQGTGELSETQLKLFEVFEERAEWAAGIPADNVGIYTVRMKTRECGDQPNAVFNTADFDGDHEYVGINFANLGKRGSQEFIVASMGKPHEMFHYRQRALGFDSMASGEGHNYSDTTRLQTSWVMEADARARLIYEAYLDNDQPALENLRSRPSYGDMTRAFEGVLKNDPHNYEAAMTSAIIAYRGRERSSLSSDQKTLNRIVFKQEQGRITAFDNTKTEDTMFSDADFANPDSPVMLVGELDEGHGNYMNDPRIKDFIRQSVSLERLAMVEKAQAQGLRLCDADDVKEFKITSGGPMSALQ